MKILISFLLFFLIAYKSNGQTIIVTRDVNGQPIPFVSVYDTVTKIYTLGDAKGVVELPRNSYTLHLNSISHIDTSITIEDEHPLDTVFVCLKENIHELKEIVVATSRRPGPGKIFQIERSGDYFTKGDIRFVLREQYKLGYHINFEKHNQLSFIRSVCFKLGNRPSKAQTNFFVEIKLFPIKNGQIRSTPLNRKQIIVPFYKLKRSNEIIIDEDIQLPQEGLFISIELPGFYSVAGQKDLVFIACSQNEQCTSFGRGLFKPYWEANTLTNSRCQQLPLIAGIEQERYISYCIGITYKNYNSTK